MRLSKAIDGFMLFKASEGLSKRSLASYQHHLNTWLEHVGDVELSEITPLDMVKYMEFMRNDYQPRRLNGQIGPLRKNTVRNIWVSLRSFWRFAEDILEVPSVMGKIKPPKVEQVEVPLLSEAEIKALLAQTKPKRAPRARSGRRYEQQLRDRAIVLLLLDTGIRVTELCNLDIGDVTLKTGRIQVEGKGARRRYVWIATITRQAIWQYLSERERGNQPERPLFVSIERRRRIGRRWLAKHLKQLGERAGVNGVHPHRFRHTFAVQYLRNGGDVFTLQILLGHSSLKMVRYYARLADVDTARVHSQVSPVDAWLKS